MVNYCAAGSLSLRTSWSLLLFSVTITITSNWSVCKFCVWDSLIDTKCALYNPVDHQTVLAHSSVHITNFAFILFTQMTSIAYTTFLLFQMYRKKCWHFKRKMLKYRHGFGAVLYFSTIILLIIILMNLESIVQSFKKSIYGEVDIRIDWHDWKLIDEDEQRIGIGEHGKGEFFWSYPAYTKKINDTHGYNGYLSDRIALNRSLKDLRPREYVWNCSVIRKQKENNIIKFSF